ncbi:MAG: NMD protein affecting ribosome stability and mRNA decay [Thermoprotei archaeon]|nr:MAG: NMD protein affecting ribosome stability and mRNA decay [Thermoprotei archaeon]
MTRYCVKCGILETEETPLINGYCPKCYLEYKGVFKKTPLLEVILCSKCGSLRFKGKWVYTRSLEDALVRILEADYKRFVNDEVDNLIVDNITNIHRINKNYYEAYAEVNASLQSKTYVKGKYAVRFRVVKTVCPNCLKKTGKSFNAIVQVRSERGYLTEDEINHVYNILMEPGISEDIVEISENKNGIDVKTMSPVIAKRIASIITRDKGAKIIESFKLRKYDPSTGRRLGIITISVRLPAINIGDVLLYKGVPGVVREYSGSRIILEKFDGEIIRVKMDEYWSGALVRPHVVLEKEYVVLGYDNTTIYLLDEATGEIKEYPRQINLYSLREGDRVRSYRIGDKMYIVRIEGGD